MARILKKVRFLRGRTNVASTKSFPGIYGPRYSSGKSGNRRVRVRG